MHQIHLQKYKMSLFLPFALCLLSAFLLNAQKPMPKRAIEITLEKEEKVYSTMKDNMRIDLNTGLPIALYGLNYPVTAGTPEEMAFQYLQNESATLGIPTNELVNLKHHATRTTNAGSVVRYRQYSGNYPVNKAEVTISISPQNKVVYVMNSYQANTPNMAAAQPVISDQKAYQLAFSYLDVRSPVMFKDNRLMVYKNQKTTRLAHEVTILANQPAGEWHVFVDAGTGEIFKVVDLNYYYCKHDDNKEHNSSCLHSDPPVQTKASAIVDGTGYIFNPDPLSSNTVAYGGGYVDGNDAITPELDAARFLVTLKDIDETGGVYTLKGPRAEIIDFDAPNTGLFTQNSPDFLFNREDQGFEPVNCYYHIDYMMSYINDTLGCNVLPYQYPTGVRYDPHGVDGTDNSYYSSGTGQLSFGEGCVDDAEDSDVIHHELGHGLHDWVTSGGLSQTDGLSEGCGDYVAQSYNRSLGNWAPSDPAYNWVFNWDGHNECWAGRITNHNVGYPGGLVNQIHADGQIWASCLMGVWDQIGQREMDKIFYEGLGATNGSSNQNDAANAVYQAALNLNYTTAQISAIHAGLTSCGYTLPVLPSDPDDAGISAVTDPTGNSCSQRVDPVVTLTNYGSNDLTSAIITYDADGGAPQVFNWTGTIASGASISITLPSLTLAPGPHTFNVATSSPNGMADSNTANDAASSSFVIASGDYDVSINLIPDNYGSETTWELRDASGAVLYSGGPYTDSNNTPINETWCLNSECYDFVIFDSYGDGICCGYGTGSYTVTNNADSTVLASGGEFASSETTNFCLTPPAIPGCTDVSAHNYNPAATVDDGSCETCSDGVLNGDETSIDCNGALCVACLTPGCTDATAHNYDPAATIDDGSCQTCADGILNGDETDIDCGGALCAPCVTGCVDTLIIDGTTTGSEIRQANICIMSTKIIEAVSISVDYHAGEYIILNAGFEVKQSSQFHAYIEGCSPPSLTETPNQKIQNFDLKLFANDKHSGTKLEFTLAQDETVTIDIFTTDGQQLVTVGNEQLIAAGNHQLQLDNIQLSAGLYLCKIKVGDTEQVIEIPVTRQD